MTAFVSSHASTIEAPVAKLSGATGVVTLTPQVTVYCHAAAGAREIAQAFIELAGLMEQRERDAAGGEPA